MPTKKWVVLPRQSDDLVQQILINRGLTSQIDQEIFLNPPPPTFETIFSLSKIDQDNFQKAIKRVLTAIKNKEKIIVYGDYDSDGITATTVLWETLYGLNGNVLPYIPDRETEGYGLNKQAITSIKEQGVSLIITVDCGITDCEEVEWAREKGLDVIVTDHHQKGAKLPSAYAIVHDDTLVGATVAWLLSEGIKIAANKDGLGPLPLGINLDLAAIGTVSDLQPLHGKNRSFVTWGLKELNQTKRLGLKTLIKYCDLSEKILDTYHVGFVLAPRLNASGRLHKAMEAVRLLCTKDEIQAISLAEQLSKLNTRRQEMTGDGVELATAQVNQSQMPKILVLADESWHEGIIGLIAARMKEEYYRPALALSINGKLAKGSARSIKGFNIIEALRQVQDLLVDCGGHPMAAGFTIELANLPEFKTRLESIAADSLTDEDLEPSLEIDADLLFSQISRETKAQIDRLRPFGVENHEPLFLLRKTEVISKQLLGKEKKHLKFLIKSNNLLPIEVLVFSQGSRFNEFNIGDYLDIAFTLDENEWQGVKKIILKAKDFRISENS